MSNTKPIKEAKRQLRRLVKSELSKIPLQSILAQSNDVRNTVTSLPKFASAKRVALYMNMPHLEVQTLDLIRYCFDNDKEVYLPRCSFIEKEGRKMNHMSMLKVPDFQNVVDLKPQGKYNLLEPLEGKDILEDGNLDLIIVPGVAFTKDKERLGHGAGFYDEFLKVYHAKFGSSPFLLGIGLQEQLVDNIPKEEHDWDLDALVIGSLQPF